MILDTLHFSYTVSDLERSLQWYVEVIGLELVHRQRQDNAYTRALVGIDDAVLEIAQLRIPGAHRSLSTHMLELVEYVRPKGAPARSLPTNDVGAAHLALMVDDIHERYARYRDQGVVFRNAPTQITEGANRGGYAAYFHDPDGFTLELLQPPDERLEELDPATRRSAA